MEKDKWRRGDTSGEKEENLKGVRKAGSSPAGIVERHVMNWRPPRPGERI